MAFWPEEKGAEVSGGILEREFGESVKSVVSGLDVSGGCKWSRRTGGMDLEVFL